MTELHEVHHTTRRQFRPYNILMILLMSLGSLGYGYSASIIATTLAQPAFISYFELDSRSDATQLISTMNGLFFAGGFFGVFCVSYAADRWGRRAAIAISASISFVASAFLAGSVHVGMFIAFRFVAGAGGFMLVAAIPIWMNEIAPPSVRGIMVDFHSVGLLLGYSMATWFGYAFYHLPPIDNWAWRGPFVIGCFPLALLIAGIYWMPESPRWLLMNNRLADADRTLRKLHTQEEAEVELLQIREAIEIDKHLDTSWWSMFAKRTYRKRCIIAMATTLSIQSSGVLVINNYGPTIYHTLGFGTNTQFLYQIGWITLSLGGGFLSLLVIDKVARPKMLAFGLAGCGACLIVLAALVSTYATSASSLANPNSGALKGAVGVIYVYILVFQVFLDGTQYAYLGELFPNQIRAKGIVVGIATICLIDTMWLQTAPTAFLNIGWQYYLCFIIPCWLFAVVAWFYFPDTLGVPLEEVAKIFGDQEELYGESHTVMEDHKAEEKVVSTHETESV